MEKEIISHESAKKNWPRAVKAGDRIYIATSGIGDDGRAVGPEFEEQFDYILSEIRETLESLDSSIDNILEMSMYFVDIERDMDKAGPILRKYIKVPLMLAALGTTGLLPMNPPLLIEVTCSAIVQE